MEEKLINQAYEIAKERYANIGIDTDKIFGGNAEFSSFPALLAGR